MHCSPNAILTFQLCQIFWKQSLILSLFSFWLFLFLFQFFLFIFVIFSSFVCWLTSTKADRIQMMKVEQTKANRYHNPWNWCQRQLSAIWNRLKFSSIFNIQSCVQMENEEWMTTWMQVNPRNVQMQTICQPNENEHKIRKNTETKKIEKKWKIEQTCC